MKKTVTKEEYICDFCGEECTEKHYDVVLPETKKENLIMNTENNTYIALHLDLCPKCTEKLSSIYEVLKNFCTSKINLYYKIDDLTCDPNEIL